MWIPKWLARNRPRTRDELHDYWRKPDRPNRPKAYLEGKERSEFLIDLMGRYATPMQTILEVGCNVGRNLAYLHRAGYRELSGIEINTAAVDQLRASYPELAQATIHNASVEEVIPRLDPYDVVFTMAVLEHIHPDSDWILEHIVRIAGDTLITIEDEVDSVGYRHFPRRYDEVFGALGMRQVEEVHCAAIVGLGPPFWARVFQPATRSEPSQSG